MIKLIYKEKLKTIIIVVLFFSTVLLSYFYWQDISLSGLKQTVNERLSTSIFTKKDIPSTSSLICPETVQVNNGDGTYSVYREEVPDLWSEFLNNYINFSKTKNLVIEEISEQIWEQAMDIKSIQYIFGYDLPVELFYMMGISDYGENEYFNSVSVMACSEASKSSIFIKDGTQNKYYRVVSDSEIGQIKAIDNESVDNMINQYYPISMVIGTDNSFMVPFATNLTMPEILMPVNDNDVVKTYEKDIAETFFGQSLEFVRKVTDDNGTITYMYGLGQKILTIYGNGRFEYKETQSTNRNNIGARKALDLVFSFIANHGSWLSYDGKELNLKLTSVNVNNNSKNSIYRFDFNQDYNNVPIYKADTSNIIIEVTGDQVTYYSRNIQIHMPTIANQTIENASVQNESIINILSSNYKVLASLLSDDHDNINKSRKSEMEVFDDVVNRITSIEIGYFGYHTDEHNQKFKPSWIFNFSDFKVFFDLYSGQYLAYMDERSE